MARRGNFLQKNSMAFRSIRFTRPRASLGSMGRARWFTSQEYSKERSERLWPKSNLNGEGREVLFCAPSVVPLGSAHNGDDVNNSEWTSGSTSNFGRERLQYGLGMVKYSRSFSLVRALTFHAHFPSFLCVHFSIRGIFCYVNFIRALVFRFEVLDSILSTDHRMLL